MSAIHCRRGELRRLGQEKRAHLCFGEAAKREGGPGALERVDGSTLRSHDIAANGAGKVCVLGEVGGQRLECRRGAHGVAQQDTHRWRGAQVGLDLTEERRRVAHVVGCCCSKEGGGRLNLSNEQGKELAGLLGSGLASRSERLHDEEEKIGIEADQAEGCVGLHGATRLRPADLVLGILRR